MPPDRLGVLLDIGANIGTHALPLARVFRAVHSFEPNPAVWPAFEKNVALNDALAVRLHKVGLGDRSADQPFYTTGNQNAGLGTFLDVEQYHLPLQCAGTARIERGDDYLASHDIRGVDAIKIDVQGLEPEVLSGLAKTLRRDRPVVWFEYGAGTKTVLGQRTEIADLFPYPVTLWRISTRPRGLSHCALSETVSGNVVPGNGNYVAVPLDE